jgi:hypothetical protein
MVPLLSPQLALPGVTTMAVGPLVLLIVTLVEKIQPFASLTWTLCEPAVNAEYTVEVVNAEAFTE